MASPNQNPRRNNKKQNSAANVEAIVNKIASQNVPEHEKILLQMRVFKEKGLYSVALQLFKKGLPIIQRQLEQDSENTALALCKARYYHYAASIMYDLSKPLKAIPYSLQAINSSKHVLDGGSVEMLRFKHVLAVAYKALEQHKDAMAYYDAVYHGLNVQIKTLQQQKNRNASQPQQSEDEKTSQNNDDNDTDRSATTDQTLQELNEWKSDVTYDIAMLYNAERNFESAAKYAKECNVLRSVFQPTAKQILALMLVAVAVSSPQITEYKVALDCLEKAKSIVQQQSSDSKDDLTQYEAQIHKLTQTVLHATVRWSKITNVDLDHYLKTGERKKKNNTQTNDKNRKNNDNNLTTINE